MMTELLAIKTIGDRELKKVMWQILKAYSDFTTRRIKN